MSATIISFISGRRRPHGSHSRASRNFVRMMARLSTPQMLRPVIVQNPDAIVLMWLYCSSS